MLSFYGSVQPFRVLQVRLERLDAVIPWPVYSPAMLEALLAAIEAGQLGPAKVLETGHEAQAA